MGLGLTLKRAILGCRLASRRNKGQGLFSMLQFHWWIRETKMPVPGAGKYTDIRNRRDGLAGGITAALRLHSVFCFGQLANFVNLVLCVFLNRFG